MSEEDLKVIQKYYASLGKITRVEEGLQQSHSIDKAKKRRASRVALKKPVV